MCLSTSREAVNPGIYNPAFIDDSANYKNHPAFLISMKKKLLNSASEGIPAEFLSINLVS